MNYEQLIPKTSELVSNMLNETLQLKIVQHAENINEAILDGTFSRKEAQEMRAFELRFAMLVDIQESLIDVDYEAAWNRTTEMVYKFQLDMFDRKMDQHVDNFLERCNDGAVSKKGLRAIEELEMNRDSLLNISDSLYDR